MYESYYSRGECTMKSVYLLRIRISPYIKIVLAALNTYENPYVLTT